MLKKIYQFLKKAKDRYFSDSILLLLPQFISLGISLITLPIILDNLLIEDYGRFQFVLAIEMWVLALTGSYITSGVKSAIANGFKGTFLYAFFFRMKLALIMALFAIIAVIVCLYLQLYIISTLLIVIFIYAFFGQIVNTSFINYLIATKRFKAKAIWEIIIAVIVNLASLISAYYFHNIIIFAISQFGSLIILSWVGFIYVSKKDNLYSEYKNKNIDKKCVSYGLKMIPANIINITSAKLSSVIIGPFLGYSILSTFSIANNLRDKFSFAVRIIDPLFYADFAKQNKKDLINAVKPRLKIFFIFSIIFTIIVIAVGYMYIHYFFPQEYQISKMYFVILALTFPFSSVSFILDVLLQSHLLHKEKSVGSITVDIIKILLILIFGYFWGIIGICIAITISSWIGFIVYYLLIYGPKSFRTYSNRENITINK